MSKDSRYARITVSNSINSSVYALYILVQYCEMKPNSGFNRERELRRGIFLFQSGVKRYLKY